MFENGFDILDSKVALVIGFAAALLILERLFPKARPLAATRLTGMATMIWRMAKNLSLAGVNGVLSWLIVVPVSAAAASYALDWRPDAWSGPHGLVIDILILDCWIYWWHRANHEIPFLWRFHEVHHLDEFLDVTTALRFHAGEVFLSSLVRAGVIYMLDMPLTSIIVFETVVLLGAIFHHSNVSLPPALEQALSKIIVTPSIHWVHHHAIRQDTDSNYATFLSVWDRLFGSRSATRRWADMPIGVEQRRDEGLPGLIVRPFRPRRR
ncbi:MAG: sterol desaturase family protein [Rhizobiales bacterium]|nr:sterol desaturase family protein [Hyphomicrobiales bacterium]